MNAVRINTAHVTTRSAATIVENVRRVSEKIAIIIDTKGPEIRLTGMAAGFAAHSRRKGTACPDEGHWPKTVRRAIKRYI